MSPFVKLPMTVLRRLTAASSQWHARACRSSADRLPKLGSKFAGDFIHSLATDLRAIARAEHLEDPRAAQFGRQVRWSGDHVEVNVREPLRLGELGDIGLLAAENLMQGPGQADLPGSQCLGLRLGEFTDRCDVPARH